MMSSMGNVVLELADHQYKFGSGPLLCRILEVISPMIFDNALWWHVRGECAYGTRAHRTGWQERELYIVDSALPVGVRRPGGTT